MRRWTALALTLVAVGCATSPRSAETPAAQPSESGPPRGSLSARPAQAPLPSEANESEADESEVDDEVELAEPAPRPPAAPPKPHPLDGVSKAELERRLRDDPASLGSLTIGHPSGGALFNGVRMPEGDHWKLVDPAHAWGTQETIDYLKAAITAVHAEFPGSHPLYIGHISAERGGALAPHISHQAGRDVDVSYFYRDPNAARWYARAHAKNLDAARSWAFVRALITRTDVEMILIDHSIQTLLKQHAVSIGEDPEWVETLFRGKPGTLRPMILHAKGHATHLHVRFYSPIAQESARRSYELMVARGLIEPPTRFVKHRVKKGETLGMLARKYKSSIQAIRQANGLRSSLIVAGREYRIPKRGGVTAPGRAFVPERRLPPPRRGVYAPGG